MIKIIVCVVLAIINIANATSTLEMMLHLQDLDKQHQERNRDIVQARATRQKQLLRSMYSALSMIKDSKTQQEQRLGIKLLRNVAWESTNYIDDEVYEQYRKNGKHKIFNVNETQNTIEIDKFPKLKENIIAIIQIASQYAVGDYHTQAGAKLVFEEVISFLKEYDELTNQ